MHLDRVTIPEGPLSLAGLVYTPGEERSRVLAVVCHGFTASKESVDILAAYLAVRGYRALTFDFRGHKLGASTGDLNHASEVLDDLETAAGWGMAQLGYSKCVLIGHSMGAMASLIVGARIEAAMGVAAITTGPKPTAGFRQPVGMAMLSQRSDYISGAEPMRLLEEFDELAAAWNGIGDRPSLFIAARGDGVVKPSRVTEMAERAGQSAEYAEIDGSHLEAPHRARGTVANWLDAHFGQGERVRG